MAPKRGRPREFDVEEAVDAAMVVFWRQGYDGTTLADLTTAMGINRPALYLAFKGKQELFVRTIDRYCEVDAKQVFGCLNEPTAQRVTEQYLLRSVALLTNPERPLGCYFLQTALVSSDANAEIAVLMANHRRTHQKLLAARYRRARKESDLRTEEDPVALSRYVSTFRHGVSVMACSGVSARDLSEAVERFLSSMRHTTFAGARRAAPPAGRPSQTKPRVKSAIG